MARASRRRSGLALGIAALGIAALELALGGWPAFAGDLGLGGPAAPESAATAISPAGLVGRLVLASALVVSLICLAVLVLRRYALPRGASGIAGPRLELIGQLHLGPRRTVYLVRIDGVEILLGTAGDGLCLLTELPGPRALAAEPPPARPAGRPFAAALGRLLGREREDLGEPTDEATETADVAA